MLLTKRSVLFIIHNFLYIIGLSHSSRGGSYFCPVRQKYAKAHLSRRSERRKQSPPKFLSFSFLSALSAHLRGVFKFILIGDFSFLLSAVWIVSTARLYLKQLSSLFTATFSLFTRLSTVHVLSTASIHFLLAPGAAIRCFFWFLRGEFTTDEKFYFIHNWVALLTITFSFCRRLDAAP